MSTTIYTNSSLNDVTGSALDSSFSFTGVIEVVIDTPMSGSGRIVALADADLNPVIDLSGTGVGILNKSSRLSVPLTNIKGTGLGILFFDGYLGKIHAIGQSFGQCVAYAFSALSINPLGLPKGIGEITGSADAVLSKISNFRSTAIIVLKQKSNIRPILQLISGTGLAVLKSFSKLRNLSALRSMASIDSKSQSGLALVLRKTVTGNQILFYESTDEGSTIGDSQSRWHKVIDRDSTIQEWDGPRIYKMKE